MIPYAKYVLLSFLVAFVSNAAAQDARETTHELKAPDAAGKLREEGRHDRTMRVVADPGTGKKWIVQKDLQHPAGPGRMIAVASDEERRMSRLHEKDQSVRELNLSVIHPGDLVIVEERSPVVDALFEGVAVSSAKSGEPVRVRLKVGGRTLDSVAIGPGHARLLPGSNEVH